MGVINGTDRASYRNTTFVSPTDNMMTPVSQKLNASRKKHFQKYVSDFIPPNIYTHLYVTSGKPVQLFSQKGDVAQGGDGEDDGGDDVSESSNTTDAKKTSLPPLKDDDENPF